MNLFSKEVFNSGKLNNIAFVAFKSIVGIATLLAVIAQITGAKHMEEYFQSDNIMLYIIFTNLVFAGLIYLLGEPTKSGWEKGTLLKRIKKSNYYKKYAIDEKSLIYSIDNLKTFFSKNWSLLWGCWALFYLVLFIHNYVGVKFTEETHGVTAFFYFLITIIENSLNLISSYFLYCLYLVLVHKSFSVKLKEKSISYHTDRKRFIFLMLFLILAEGITYLSYGTKTVSVNNYFEVMISLNSFFKLINGFVASVTLALFISRLIGSHTTVFRFKESIVLPLLLLYCAIQPCFVYLNKSDEIILTSCILLVALICKYILYYVVVVLFDSRKILFHFIETSVIKSKVSESLLEFENVWEEKNK